MPKYNVSVDLVHNFYSFETYECEIEAVSQDEAFALGEKKALQHCDPDSWGAEFDKTEINGGEAKMIEGTDIEPPYRCDKTSDMFEVRNA